jgi:acyl-CoA synthetase (AMP-forming)/AMP-acid ligase II
MKTIRTYIDALALDGERIAVVSADGAVMLEQISRAELANRVRRTSLHLVANCGVTVGSRVALSPQNDISGLVTFLAIVYVGATCVMVPATDPSERRVEKVRGTRASLWISDNPVASMPGIRLETLSSLASLDECPGSALLDANIPNADDPAVIFFTTGSTAAAKAVVQSHGNVVSNCAALVSHHGLGKDDRVLGVLPMHYANGLELSLLTPLISGGTAILLRSFDPMTYLDACTQHRASIASVVPAILDAICASRFNPDLPCLRYFISAAAPLSSRTANAVWARFSKRVVQGYGLSETTNFSTSLPIDLSVSEYREAVLDATIPMVGMALIDCELVVRDKEGRAVDLGVLGEVSMRGDSVMLGYDANPAANAEAFRDGWFHSGDEGFLSLVGERPEPMLTLTGRFKNTIKVGGIGVSLDEIDRLVQALEGVRDAVSVRASHTDLGESVLVLIKADSEAPDETCEVAANVRAALEQTVGIPHAGLAIEFRQSLPRTPNGKVLRW